MLATGTHFRRLAVALLICGAPMVSGCEKKAPPDAHLQRGYALVQTDPEAALEEFKSARQPSGTPALVGQALAFEGLQDYAQAKTFLNQALKTGQNVDGVRLLLTRVHVMLGELDEAKATIDHAVRDSGSVLGVLLLEACLADDARRAEASLTHLESWRQAQEAREVRPHIVAEFFLARASAYRTLKREQEAAADTKKASLKQVTDEREAVSLAVVASFAGREQLAVGLLERLLGSEVPPRPILQIGELAHRLGQKRLVETVLVLSTDPSPEYAQLKARHDVARRSPKALQSIKAALQRTSDVDKKERLRLMLANTLIESKKRDEAIKELSRKFQNETLAAQAQILRARVALLEGETDVALEIIAPLLKKKALPMAHEVAILAHHEKGNEASALKHAGSLLESNPAHPMAGRMFVSLSLAANQGEEAEKKLRALVTRAPGEMQLRLLWLEVLRKTKPASEVIAALRASLELNPGEPQLWLQLADLLRKQSDDAGALDALRQAHEKNPKDPLLAAALAGVLSGRGLNEEAGPIYAKVLEHSKDDVVALNNLAVYYTDQLKEPRRAVPLAERAHRMTTNPAIADTLAWALIRRNDKGDLSRALHLLKHARLPAASATTQYHLGVGLIESGEVEEGRSFLRLALAHTGGFEDAAEAKKLLARVQ